jgi:hypothetical protein
MREITALLFIQEKALTRLLVQKGIFAKDEFLEMVRLVDQEMGRKQI